MSLGSKHGNDLPYESANADKLILKSNEDEHVFPIQRTFDFAIAIYHNYTTSISHN